MGLRSLTKLNRVWIDHNIKLQSKIAKSIMIFLGGMQRVGVWSELPSVNYQRSKGVVDDVLGACACYKLSRSHQENE